MKTALFRSFSIFLRWVALFWLGFYQCVLRGHFGGGGCRLTPTCSVYTRDMILCHGLLKGGRLAMKRLVTCHPFGKK